MTSKFTELPDNEDMIFRQVRENIEIGVAPMIYGYRIRANILGEGSCWIDYCAGSDVKEVENIYSLVISIMNKRMDEFNPGSLPEQLGISNDIVIRQRASHTFKDFPRQNVKPMFNDFECFMKLSEMCGPEIISMHLPNLAARKTRHVLTYNLEVFDTLNKMGGFDDLLED